MPNQYSLSWKQIPEVNTQTLQQKRTYDDSPEVTLQERFGASSHRRQGFEWMGGEEVESAPLSLVSSAISHVHSHHLMNFPPWRMRQSSRFRGREHGHRRRKCLTDAAQVAGAAFRPRSIVYQSFFPAPGRAGEKERGRRVCEVQVGMPPRHLPRLEVRFQLDTYQILKHRIKVR